ncbi:MAG: sigma-70 family RNA polymerase sigma factor [Ruminococcaceae bacterium]|nr:sigma-70 family RNA polymerase sigma factor [Oscillospiraceae bacterium]
MSDGKQTYFSEVYRTYHPVIFQYVHKRLSSLHDAQDLTSEIFETACRYYPGYDRAKSSVATWLYVIANSRLKNHYRKSRMVFADIDELEAVLRSAENISESMESAEALQQMRDVLADSLEKLSERSRRAVVMKYFLNCSTEEIAEALDTTDGNIRVILSRALRQMRNDIALTNTNWEKIIYG